MTKDMGASAAPTGLSSQATEPQASPPDGLQSLALRCEAAAGPDRELDGSIWWATRSPEEIKQFDRSGFVRECIERAGSAGKALAQFYDSANPGCLGKMAFRQAYTASLDAAMTLVPEGLCIRLGINTNPKARLLGGAVAAILEADFAADVAKAEGKTPALALCAAALRARSAQAIDAATAGETGNTGSTEGESAVPNGDAPKGDES